MEEFGRVVATEAVDLPTVDVDADEALRRRLALHDGASPQVRLDECARPGPIEKMAWQGSVVALDPSLANIAVSKVTLPDGNRMGWRAMQLNETPAQDRHGRRTLVAFLYIKIKFAIQNNGIMVLQ